MAASAALERFHGGAVIPAHPLALTGDLALDERRQRALSRYYLDAGAGGLAVGVHTTQFGIHFEHSHLLKPVLALAANAAAEHGDPATVLIAGVCGGVRQVVAEAELAAELGYHAVLVAPYGEAASGEAELLEAVRQAGAVLPVVGFYLQPAVGGRPLGPAFWRRLAEIESVVGVKIAPFDRYATLDVLAGIAGSGRVDRIALYTGNDDHIIGDLLMRYPLPDGSSLEFVGGLLGQWSVWTREAVRVLELSRAAKAGDRRAWHELRDLDAPLTAANAAIFDVDTTFAGCLPGIHEVLRRQGLLDDVRCLDGERMSPGQLEKLDHVWSAYPQLRDDAFVAEHLPAWLD